MPPAFGPCCGRSHQELLQAASQSLLSFHVTDPHLHLTCETGYTLLAWLTVAASAALPAADFPNVDRYREILAAYDLSSFPKVTDAVTAALESALAEDIPRHVAAFENPF